MQACSRIVRACGVASSRQFLGKHVPRRVGERSLYLKQDKRASTKDELGIFIFGLGALSAASVWVSLISYVWWRAVCWIFQDPDISLSRKMAEWKWKKKKTNNLGYVLSIKLVFFSYFSDLPRTNKFKDNSVYKLVAQLKTFGERTWTWPNARNCLRSANIGFSSMKTFFHF